MDAALLIARGAPGQILAQRRAQTAPRSPAAHCMGRAPIKTGTTLPLMSSGHTSVVR